MGLTDEHKNWISEQLEATGTRLLRAFHDPVSPRDLRARSHSAILRMIEIESLLDRISKPGPPL